MALELRVDRRVEGVEHNYRPFAARVHVAEQVLEELEALRVVLRGRGRLFLDPRHDGCCLRFDLLHTRWTGPQGSYRE